MRTLRYVDFDLRLQRDGSHYTASVVSPAGEAQSTFSLPLSPDKIENLILRIGRRLGGRVRRVHSSEMEAARELGGSLFEALFTGNVRDCYTRSLDQITKNENAGLRLRLRLQDVPELADLPWEFLLDRTNGRFVAHSMQTPLVRYVEMSQSLRPLLTTLPLRVLVMISAPIDEPGLDQQEERNRLEQAFEPLRKQGKVEVTWQEDATLPALMRYLRKQSYHIFHFVGHGAFDAKRDVGLLVLEDEQERSARVESDRIGAFLHDHPSLRLAVLNSCEGARSSRNDPFAGVAANLVRQGIPAVVAMQFEISDEAAITFAGEFYSALAEGVPVDAAVAEARKAIYATNDVEWATPVLYMRSPNGVLFKLAAPKDPEQRQREEEEQRARELERQRAEEVAKEEARREQEAQVAAARAREEEEQREREREQEAQVAAARAREEEEQREREREQSIAARAERRRKAEAEARLKRERGEAAEVAKKSSAPAPPQPFTPPDEPETPGITRTAWIAVSAIVGVFILILVLASQNDGGFDSSAPPPPPSVYAVTLSVSPATVSVSVGDTIQLIASSTNSDGTTATPYAYWSSSDPAVATVSPYSGAVTGVAPGTAVITAASGVSGQAQVTVLANATYDISDLRANVGRIRLFASGDTLLARSARSYRTSFDADTTRFVNVELELTHPASTAAREAKIPCAYYDAAGAVFGRVEINAYVAAGETVSWQALGLGWKDAGNWTPGGYRVTCRFGGKTIGRSSFTIQGSVVAPPPPPVTSYDIAVLKARVTGFRFFEGPYETPTVQQRDYSRRFDHLKARYIYSQLELAFPATEHAVDVSLTCKFYQNGSEWWSRPVSIPIPAGWTGAWSPISAGWTTAGNWTTGTYRVQCMADGRVIADDTFDIY